MAQVPRVRPILFSAAMVRAILEGRKTQTRRVIVPQPRTGSGSDLPACRYGSAGDALRVRERWGYRRQFEQPRARDGGAIVYAADPHSIRLTGRAWRPSRYMPRLASRINLHITALRIERLRDITPADARAEGFDQACDFADPVQWFANIWDQINANGGYSWLENPWVWVVSFRVVAGC
jgi:hypothetical protein